jgi:RimJ/RimL family protein N-acetyltransferase
MDLLAFIDFHEPALENDQVRHNLILGLLLSAKAAHDQGLMFWTLGPPGACAIKSPGRWILLGELSDAQCYKLAEETVALDYPGVVGPDQTALQFRARAEELGLRFEDSVNQGISALSDAPIRPDVPGEARRVTADDLDLFARWTHDFLREAVLHDPPPQAERLKAKAEQGDHWFWTVNGQPVSLAGIMRRTREAAAIASVYTPPAQRNRGFAGAVVATVVEQIFAEGRTTACLYTDLANPISNRCYERIGFKRVCTAGLQLRQRS